MVSVENHGWSHTPPGWVAVRGAEKSGRVGDDGNMTSNQEEQARRQTKHGRM